MRSGKQIQIHHPHDCRRCCCHFRKTCCSNPPYPPRAHARDRSTAQAIGTDGFACAAEAAGRQKVGAVGVVAPPSSGSAWPIAAARSRQRSLRVMSVPLITSFPGRVSRTPTSPPLATTTIAAAAATATTTPTTTGVLSEKSRGNRERKITPTKPLSPIEPLAPTKPLMPTNPLAPAKPLTPIKPRSRSTPPTPAAVRACRGRVQGRGRWRRWAMIS